MAMRHLIELTDRKTGETMIVDADLIYLIDPVPMKPGTAMGPISRHTVVRPAYTEVSLGSPAEPEALEVRETPASVKIKIQTGRPVEMVSTPWGPSLSKWTPKKGTFAADLLAEANLSPKELDDNGVSR